MLSNKTEEAAAFGRFTDLMAKLMVKYGPAVLKKRQEDILKEMIENLNFRGTSSDEALRRRLNAYHCMSEEYRRVA